MLSAKEVTTFRFLVTPTISVATNVLLAVVLSLTVTKDNDDSQLLSQATTMAGMVSSASLTIVTLTFSLTVLSIQIASQTYSPRLLDDFLKNPMSNCAVALNLGAYAYAYTLTYFLHDESNVPYVAIQLLTVHMAIVLLMFVLFIHQFINDFRLESILHKAAEASWEAAKDLEDINREHGVKATDDLPPVPNTAFKVMADVSGYLARHNLDGIAVKAEELGVYVRYHPSIGEFVTEGSLLAYVWEKIDAGTDPSKRKKLGFGRNSINHVAIEERLGAWISSGVEITTGRSGRLDVLLGISQLSDVAVKALSAAINDPMSAVQALDYLSALFARLATLDFYISCGRDSKGAIRCSAPRRSFVYMLSMLDAIRFYGASDLQINYRLLRFYGDIGSIAKRLNKQDHLLAILAQLEQCMIVCRENFGEDSFERKSLEEAYEHSMTMLKQAEKIVLSTGESLEEDVTVLETTYVKPSKQFLESLDNNILPQGNTPCAKNLAISCPPRINPSQDLGGKV